MTVVADSSVWVSYLRTGTKGSGGALDGLLASEQIRMCGPVAAELLVGTPAAHRAELWTLLTGLPWADLGREQDGVFVVRGLQFGRQARQGDPRVSAE